MNTDGTGTHMDQLLVRTAGQEGINGRDYLV